MENLKLSYSAFIKSKKYIMGIISNIVMMMYTKFGFKDNYTADIVN